MRLLRYFASRYATESVVVLLCLLLAGALEGVGLSALIPVLTLLMESGSPASESSQLGTAVKDAFAAIDIVPSLQLGKRHSRRHASASTPLLSTPSSTARSTSTSTTPAPSGPPS